ncbi:MAG TPA: methylmalonyl Co-A mutase-associated GTPase MeaB [Prolixibacteraceae bacterium]|nr:methylmalonyl Co-A mutase-associated GTPase MeaB [Prolixibacteraceae bacterium]
MLPKDKHIENHPDYKGLKVNEGIDRPAPVSETSVRKFLQNRRRQPTAAEFVEGILKGDITMLSRAVTMVESVRPEHQMIARQVISECLPYSGKSIRVGITGVPGAGKSTFIEALGTMITREGHKLAVLAIDPSSERSRGSILGDKTRMEELSSDPNAYIRPSPSAGSLGGVARKTRETVILCEAAGFDTIFIETVGVGQSETAVHSMTDFFLLLMLAGAGDELQGIKRGIMEMADLVAINKADGNNVEKAGMARVQYKNALHLFPAKESKWDPKVLTCSSIEKTGVREIWDSLTEYRRVVTENGYFQANRNDQARFWMYETIDEQLRQGFYQSPAVKAMLDEMERRVMNVEVSSFEAARLLLEIYRKPTPC